MANNQPGRVLTDEELAAFSAIRARAAHNILANPAALLRHEAIAMQEGAYSNWLSTIQQRQQVAVAQAVHHAQAAQQARHQVQQQANAAAATHKVQPGQPIQQQQAQSPAASGKLNSSSPELTSHPGVIPIGFFRDPRGNAWAASLQNPAQAARAAALMRDKSAVADLAAYQAATAAHQASVKNRQNSLPSSSQPPVRPQPKPMGRKEVIEIPSDDEDEGSNQASSNEKPGTNPFRPAPAPAVPARVPTVSTVSKRPAPFPAVSQPAKRPTPEPQRTQAKPPTQPPVPQQQPRYEQASVTDQSSSQTLAGSFTTKWLKHEVNREDENKAMRDCFNKLLLAATGFTGETAPPNVPFPPHEITLDQEQLAEVCNDLVQERFAAVTNAICTSYAELKSKHDEILLKRTENRSVAANLKQEIMNLKIQHKAELKETKDRNNAFLQKWIAQVKELREELQITKDQLAEASAKQTKCVETLLQASIVSLRMMDKKRREEQQQRNGEGSSTEQ